MRASCWWVLGLVGCAKAPEVAPVDLSEGLQRLFRDYDDPTLRADAAGALDRWLREDGGDDLYWEGVLIENLGEEQIGDLLDFQPVYADHRGVATVYQSGFDAFDHAALASLPDQTWTDPNFDRYDRTLLDGDPATFPMGDSSLLTRNEIIRSGGFGIAIPYTLRKDYHWVDVRDGEALLSRWWLETPGCSDNGKNCVLQSYGVEVYAPRDAGALRLIANWIQTVTQADGLISEDGMIQLIADGNQDLMEGTDEHLAGQ